MYRHHYHSKARVACPAYPKMQELAFFPERIASNPLRSGRCQWWDTRLALRPGHEQEEDFEYIRRLMREGVPTALHVSRGTYHSFPLAQSAQVPKALAREQLAGLKRAFHSGPYAQPWPSRKGHPYRVGKGRFATTLP